MNGHMVVTVGFTRTVRARGLRPGDVFAFPQAPKTPLTVTGVEKTVLSPELTLLAVTIPGRDAPVHLLASTPVHSLRMLRTIPMTCLLCGKHVEIELDLPKDGEPLSLVCDDHMYGTESSAEAEAGTTTESDTENTADTDPNTPREAN
ncbi:hypothetical protein OK074_2080 [Actinobacteria bacterium OK074]|nr:hypothetical protein OK074_2080 [Actinobacteria bacterium OK074]